MILKMRSRSGAPGERTGEAPSNNVGLVLRTRIVPPQCTVILTGGSAAQMVAESAARKIEAEARAIVERRIIGFPQEAWGSNL